MIYKAIIIKFEKDEIVNFKCKREYMQVENDLIFYTLLYFIP